MMKKALRKGCSLLASAAILAAAMPLTVNAENEALKDLETEEMTLVGAGEDDAAGSGFPADGEMPARFDLRDYGYVTPVKQQAPWGTCWVFGSIAAAETSILSAMGKTYEETGIDLSEKFTSWYSAEAVPEEVSVSQAGEGVYRIDESDDDTIPYKAGGRSGAASSMFASGIGPQAEADFPYRNSSGALMHDYLLERGEEWRQNYFDELRAVYPVYSVSDEELRKYVEREYAAILAETEAGDYYAETKGEWAVPERDSSGLLNYMKGSLYTLTDSNEFNYLFHSDDEDRNVFAESVQVVKRELMRGHGVAFDTEMSNRSLNKETGAVYTRSNGSSNHMMCIIGWDDTYPAENFNVAPPGDGAWIVKNSWGSETDYIPDGLTAADGTAKAEAYNVTGYRNEEGKATGYLYLSYYDSLLDNMETFEFDLSPNNDIVNALQYDLFRITDGMYYFTRREGGIIKEANIYPIDHDLLVNALGIRVNSGVWSEPDYPVSISAELYRLNEDASDPDDGELLGTIQGDFEYEGYHRMELETPLRMKAGERLGVVVTNIFDAATGNPAYNVSAGQAISKKNSRLKGSLVYGVPLVNPGESFLYHNLNGEYKWDDIGEPMTEEMWTYLYSKRIGGLAQYPYPENPPSFAGDLKIDNWPIKVFTEPYEEPEDPGTDESGSGEVTKTPEDPGTDESGSEEVTKVPETPGADESSGEAVTKAPETVVPGTVTPTPSVTVTGPVPSSRAPEQPAAAPNAAEKAARTSPAANTGDETNVFLWILLAGIALLVLKRRAAN